VQAVELVVARQPHALAPEAQHAPRSRTPGASVTIGMPLTVSRTSI
jgi:hypothetical protein